MSGERATGDGPFKDGYERAMRSLAAETARAADEGTAVETLMARCARPCCRRAFAREIARGRPREFCSDECRRDAEVEYKRAQAVVAHFEKQVAVARLDLATFGRDDALAPAPSGGTTGDNDDE